MDFKTLLLEKKKTRQTQPRNFKELFSWKADNANSSAENKTKAQRQKDIDSLKYYAQQIKNNPRDWHITLQNLPYIKVFEKPVFGHSIGGGNTKSTPAGIFTFPMVNKYERDNQLNNIDMIIRWGYNQSQKYFMIAKINSKYKNKILYTDQYSFGRLAKDLTIIFSWFKPKQIYNIIFKSHGGDLMYEFGNKEKKEFDAIENAQEYATFYIKLVKKISRQSKETVVASEALWEVLKAAYFRGAVKKRAFADWAAAFRKLGYAGFVDTGEEIVHSAEAAQGVFFTADALDIVYYIDIEQLNKDSEDNDSADPYLYNHVYTDQNLEYLLKNPKALNIVLGDNVKYLLEYETFKYDGEKFKKLTLPQTFILDYHINGNEKGLELLSDVLFRLSEKGNIDALSKDIYNYLKTVNFDYDIAEYIFGPKNSKTIKNIKDENLRQKINKLVSYNEFHG